MSKDTHPMTHSPDSAELLPCPFCGGTNVKTHGPYGWYQQWCISHSCRAFYSGTSEMIQGFPTEAEAIAAWNTRSPGDVGGVREVIARIIDPLAFKSWDSVHSYFLNAGDDPEEARKTADRWHKSPMDEALAKADAILALLPQGDGWRPIAEAPRDGTKFDAWIPDSFGGHRMCDLSFNRKGQLRQNGILNPVDLPRWPTHFMPLPSPPTPAEER